MAEISDLTEDKEYFLEQQIGKMKQGISRLIDAYAEGHIEKQDFELRIKSIKQRLLLAEEQVEKQKVIKIKSFSIIFKMILLFWNEK